MRKVVGAIIMRGPRVLLVRKRVSGLWLFPGGTQRNGESEEGCLIREVWEELSCRTLPALECLGVFEGIGLPGQKVRLACFLIRLDGFPSQLSLELCDSAWVGSNEIVGYPITEVTRLCLDSFSQWGLW